MTLWEVGIQIAWWWAHFLVIRFSWLWTIQWCHVERLGFWASAYFGLGRSCPIEPCSMDYCVSGLYSCKGLHLVGDTLLGALCCYSGCSSLDFYCRRLQSSKLFLLLGFHSLYLKVLSRKAVITESCDFWTDFTVLRSHLLCYSVHLAKCLQPTIPALLTIASLALASFDCSPVNGCPQSSSWMAVSSAPWFHSRLFN